MKTILIVDDDVCIGNMLEEILSQQEFRTARAYSGTEALMYPMPTVWSIYIPVPEAARCALRRSVPVSA